MWNIVNVYSCLFVLCCFGIEGVHYQNTFMLSHLFMILYVFIDTLINILYHKYDIRTCNGIYYKYDICTCKCICTYSCIYNLSIRNTTISCIVILLSYTNILTYHHVYRNNATAYIAKNMFPKQAIFIDNA